MAAGEKLGEMTCPCCGGAWVGKETKGGGVSLTCPRGFQGLGKGPHSSAGIRAKLTSSAPAPAPKPAGSGPKPAPAKPKGGLAAFLLGDDE